MERIRRRQAKGTAPNHRLFEPTELKLRHTGEARFRELARLPARSLSDREARAEEDHAVMSEVVAPAIEHFQAEWLFVSAGFDAHVADPLAHLRLEADDYMAMAAALATHPGRTVLFAEGGYDLDAVSHSMTASVAGVGGRRPGPTSAKSPEAAWRLVEQARRMAAESGGL